jgi:EAL domain-containing protein (putative c-di-GMP-specific phosphodiesterase class I)/GGDEF domain-containing protein
MSLIRQIWLLLFTVLALAVGGAVAVNLVSARETLEAQMGQMNADNAMALALALSQQGGDTARMRELLSAQAETRRYLSIRYLPADGADAIGAGPPFERRFEAHAAAAPGWFRALIPIEPETGIAHLADGHGMPGRIEVALDVQQAQDALWRGGSRALMWMALVGTVAALLAWRGVQHLQRVIEATVRQAQSLGEGRYIAVKEPAVPELRRMAAAMNAMVERMRRLFETQAGDAERWRRQAHCDALTGLPHRAHFLGSLVGLLQREDGADRGGLVLVRLGDLDNLNRRLGRSNVDSALRSVAALFQTYTDRVPDCLAGRLNGADFTLFLPEAGLAAETAAALSASLRAALAAHGSEFTAHLGAVELRRDTPISQWMAQADLALARAETGEPFSLVVLEGAAPALGERLWREQLLAALADRQGHLVEFPVLDACGALMYLECPLRLRLQAGDEAQAAAHWLPLALRCRLTPAVDLEAARLALTSIAHDGRPRGVNIAPASLADPNFVTHLLELVQARPEAARGLWVDVAERAALARFRQVQDLARQLRPLGVHVGLEHAGPRLHEVEQLYELGLDFVKLDASVCAGVADSEAAQEFVRGSVRLLVAIGVQVQAEGVVRAEDARALWACGVEAMTGPWASAQDLAGR